MKLNITHTWDDDLVVTVIHPDGTRILLVDQRGGSSDNFVDTWMDDDTSNSITTGSAPFTGTFAPEVSLSGLDGKSVTGTWTLEIQDTADQDGGALTEWKLEVNKP